MRFRGGSVGHLGMCYLDTWLKEDIHTLNDEQEDNSELIISGGNGIEEDTGTQEEHTHWQEPGDDSEEDDEEEDIDHEEDERADEGTNEGVDEEMEESGNIGNEQDKDEEVMNDYEILDEEGFAEL